MSVNKVRRVGNVDHPSNRLKMNMYKNHFVNSNIGLIDGKQLRFSVNIGESLSCIHVNLITDYSAKESKSNYHEEN